MSYTAVSDDGQPYLVLEFGRISPMHRYGSAVHMQFPNDATPSFVAVFLHKLWAECTLLGTLSQTQQPD
jgi:hypothetical protein